MAKNFFTGINTCMRIIPVIQNYLIYPHFKENYELQNSHKAFAKDSVSFQAQKFPVIESHKAFKQLGIKKKVHCIYCNSRLTFDNSMIDKWKKDKVFQGPIRTFVRVLKPYKTSLRGTEYKLFEIIDNISKKSPDAHLSNVIKILAVQSNKKLLELQTPVLNKILKLSKELPPEYQEKLNTLIMKNTCRLLKIPYVEEFSTKDFSYKVGKITKLLNNNDKDVKKIKKLTNILTIPELKDNETDISEEALEKIRGTIAYNLDNPNYRIGKHVKKSRLKAKYLIIENIKNTASKLNRNDIVKLCEDSQKRLDGVPVAGKFSNKAFSHDLYDVLKDINDTKLRAEICKLAEELPTSETSIHAFILKHDEASSDTIGTNLLEPSVITVEHMKPSSEGGVDALKNWAYACKRCNNKRQSGSMKSFFSNFPENNANRYWKDIVKLSNKGYFSFEDTREMLKTFKRQSGIKIESNKNLRYIPDVNV